MPVEAQTVEYVYTGDGVATVFPFPSKFLSTADIIVALDSQEQTGGFSVAGAGVESGGAVTFLAAPPSGVRVSLLRKPAASQLLDFINGQTVLEGVLDTGFDKLTMLIQYLLRGLQKSVRLSEFDSTVLTPIGVAAQRANMLLAFDSTGQPTVAAQADATLLLASQAEAEAGENNTKFMSPLRVAQSLAAAQFAFIAAATAATISPAVHLVSLDGFSSAADGGYAVYQRVSAQPAHPGRFRSTDRYLPTGVVDEDNGGWWEIVEDGYRPQQFGGTDTAAIQAAIDTAAIMGKHVFLSGGTYTLSGPIVMRQGVDLIGDGAVIKMTVTGQDMVRNFVAGGAYSGRTAAGYWKIVGIVFDGDATTLSSSASMFNLCQAIGVTVERCTFRNIRGGHMFDLAGMKDVLFVNCSFQSHTPLSPDLFKEVIQVDICSSTGFPYGLDASSYDSAPCDGVTVRACTFTNTGRPIGSHGWSLTGYADYWHTRINIDGMTVRGCSYDTVGAQRWKNFHWRDIDSDGSSGTSVCFLRIDDSTDFLVENCRGVAASSGVRFSGRGIFVNRSTNTAEIRNWAIVDCIIDGVTSGNGLDLYQAMNGRVTRPVLRNIIDGTNVNVSTCSRVAVHDADIIAAAAGAASGFVVASSTWCRLLGGHVRGTYTNAIVVNGGSDNVADGIIIEDLATGRTGALIGSSAARPTVRNCILNGTAGTGVSFSGAVTGGWADGNDARGMSGGTKYSLAGTSPLNTNNLS